MEEAGENGIDTCNRDFPQGLSYKIGMVLDYDHGLFEAIENFLRGDKNYNFLSEVKNMDLFFWHVTLTARKKG